MARGIQEKENRTAAGFPFKKFLADNHGRVFRYLRLSLTEECNFKCIYCLPDGYKRSEHYELPLTRAEVRNLVSAFGAMNFNKVRLTGGEPTLRRDIVEIVSDIAQIKAIRKIGLTTNAYRLKQLAKPLKDAGLTSINVSLDTLDRERFRQITGLDRLRDVLDGIEASFQAGFTSIKINSVLMKNTVEHDADTLIHWAKDKPFSIRFIEIMRTGVNAGIFEKQHIRSGELKLKLLQNGWRIRPRDESADESSGPAVEFVHRDYLGSVGIIAPYSTAFCDSCNRLRINSKGALRLCLFGENDFSLRDYLKSPNQKHELAGKVFELINGKNKHHRLNDNEFGLTRSLSSIGG